MSPKTHNGTKPFEKTLYKSRNIIHRDINLVFDYV